MFLTLDDVVPPLRFALALLVLACGKLLEPIAADLTPSRSAFLALGPLDRPPPLDRRAAADDGADDGATARSAPPPPPMFVIFGRPGAGKSTIADAVVAQLGGGAAERTLALDLDVCVPQWMRDNFAAGVYPTPEQRAEFARGACDYVDRQLLDDGGGGDGGAAAVVVSFSFVNDDLRDVFRARFPRARWLLVDTAPAEASRRVAAREGHFYAGDAAEAEAAADSEWAFAPVAFEHSRLDGAAPLRENAEAVIAEMTKGPPAGRGAGSSSTAETSNRPA